MHEKRPTLLQQAEAITDAYVSLMLLLLPLFTGLHGYQHITEAKFGLFVCLTGLWLAGLLLLRLRGFRDPRPWPAECRRMGIFLLWVGLSVVFSPYPLSVTFFGGSWRTGFFSTLLYVTVGAFCARYGTFREHHAHLLGLSVTLCCLVAVLQIAGFDPLQLYPHGWRFQDAGTLYSGMYLGTVGNTLVLASVLSFALPLLVLTAVKRRGRTRWLLLPAALGLYVILRSDASSAEAALLGAAWLMLPFFLTGKKRRRARCIGLALVFLALAGIRFWRSAPGMLGELSAILRGELDDSFGSHRVQIWRAVLETVPGRPLLGGGPGTLGQRIHVVFTRFVPETGNTLQTAVNNAHNEYLGYLADSGIPAPVFYIGIMSATVRRALREGDPLSPVGWGVVCYWIQAFFALGLCLSAPLLWIGWGLWIGETRASDQPTASDLVKVISGSVQVKLSSVSSETE